MIAPSLTQLQARLVFSHLPNIGPILCERLSESFNGNLSEALAAPLDRLLLVQGIGKILAENVLKWRNLVDLPRIESQLHQANVEFIIPEDNRYPALLKKTPDAPIGLYLKGKLEPMKPNIAIVGSRRSTLYGMGVAQRFAGKLAERGFTVVSGMARGIDGAAHKGALESKGHTIGVLGTGVDLIYPPEHADLYKNLTENGGLISEFTLSRPADRQTFPMRNRIIAGMSYATIVVESDCNGGSMITAKLAGELGRTVFAVPGRIDQVSSRGCHTLIREGATLLTDIDEAIEDLLPVLQHQVQLNLEFSKPMPAWNERPDLTPTDNTLLKMIFEGGPASLDQLAETLDWPIHRLSSSLMSLEIKQCLVKRMDGRFEAKRLSF